MVSTTPMRSPVDIERVALLDMRFEIADMTAGFELFARAAGKPGARQRLAQRHPIVAALRPVDLIVAERADERAAAEIAAVMAFLVGPGGDLDAEPGTIGVGGKGARELKPVDHPQCAIEPAAIGLGLAVRADQEPPLCPRVASDDVADAVDGRIEPGFAQFPGKPVPRFDIDRRIGRAVDAGFVAAEFREPLQIGDDAPTVDARHCFALTRGDRPKTSLGLPPTETTAGVRHARPLPAARGAARLFDRVQQIRPAGDQGAFSGADLSGRRCDRRRGPLARAEHAAGDAGLRRGDGCLRTVGAGRHRTCHDRAERSGRA